jgi:hypothetical protein
MTMPSQPPIKVVLPEGKSTQVLKGVVALINLDIKVGKLPLESKRSAHPSISFLSTNFMMEL